MELFDTVFNTEIIPRVHVLLERDSHQSNESRSKRILRKLEKV